MNAFRFPLTPLSDLLAPLLSAQSIASSNIAASFEAGSGISASAMARFFLLLLVAVIWIWAAWAGVAQFVNWFRGGIRLDQYGFFLIALMVVVLMALTWLSFFSSNL